MVSAGEVTQLLRGMSETDDATARVAVFDQAIPLVYDELRACARALLSGERGQVPQATELLHDAFLRMRGIQKGFENRQHLLSMGVLTLRRLLVERARAIQTAKRGRRQVPELLDESLVAAEERDADTVIHVERALTQLKADEVELVELRYYARFTVEETAEILGVSPATVKKRWTAIKKKLKAALDGNCYGR